MNVDGWLVDAKDKLWIEEIFDEIVTYKNYKDVHTTENICFDTKILTIKFSLSIKKETLLIYFYLNFLQTNRKFFLFELLVKKFYSFKVDKF